MILIAACTVVLATPIAAQSQAGDVRVTFADGRVSVIAAGATLGDILREWTRAGGSRFINVERIPITERLTIRLENETELHALDVLLRSLAGYAATARPQGAPGLSSIGSVVILPRRSRPMVYGQLPDAMPTPFPPRRPVNGAQPTPDEDGPARRELPPPGRPEPGRQGPMGYTSPLEGLQIQAAPGMSVTPSQSGTTTTRPRPGGGGG